MKGRQLPLLLSVLGLVVILVGLICRAKSLEVWAIPLEGVGASILATGFTSLVLLRKARSPFESTLEEVLSEGTHLRRVNQSLDLYFESVGDRIQLTKRHTYSLHNPTDRSIARKVEMFTDLPPDDPMLGSFDSVETPSDGVLSKEALAAALEVDRKAGKQYFRKYCVLPPGESGRFVFTSHASFRRSDRLVWTVQDLSDSFQVRLTNESGPELPFVVKVNHHHESSIMEAIRRSTMADKGVLELSIPFTLLPYQGFELSWRFD